jgi:hypothetical protein
MPIRPTRLVKDEARLRAPAIDDFLRGATGARPNNFDLSDVRLLTGHLPAPPSEPLDRMIAINSNIRQSLLVQLGAIRDALRRSGEQPQVSRNELINAALRYWFAAGCPFPPTDE